MKIPSLDSSVRATPDKTAADPLVKATRELEAVFVRTLLAATPLGAKGDAYGGMAVDAVAGAVTQGRGMGLGEMIRRTLSGAPAHKAPTSPQTSAPEAVLIDSER